VARRFAAKGWMVGIALLGLGFDEPDSSVKIALDQPSARKPLVAGAALSAPKVRAGETVTLVVRAKLAPTWHIYAADETSGGNIPTTLKLNLPDGVEAVGDWSYPAATRTKDVEGAIYEGDLTFRRKLRIAGDAAPGSIQVTCELGYQACDPFSCRAPDKLSLKAKAEVGSR
jgi:DsbC/DsbD-like thiol-disulfide interchange protein